MKQEALFETPNLEERVTAYKIPRWSIKLVRDGGITTQVRQPKDVADLLVPLMKDLDQENVIVLALDTKNNIRGIHTVYVGSVNACAMRMGELFKAAILSNATSIIVAHNHPSGDATPSPEDLFCTQQMVQAGKVLDITVLDHIVVGEICTYSIHTNRPDIFA